MSQFVAVKIVGSTDHEFVNPFQVQRVRVSDKKHDGVPHAEIVFRGNSRLTVRGPVGALAKDLGKQLS